MSKLSPEFLRILKQLSVTGPNFDPDVIVMVLDDEQRVQEYRLETLSSVAPLLSLHGLLENSSIPPQETKTL